MKQSTPLLVLLVFISFSRAFKEKTTNNLNILEPVEDAFLSTPELITKYGYPVETHEVITEDGYILSTHRIPHGKNTDKTSNKVVLLVHCLLGSSAAWLLTGPNHALAYRLADEGYDVWMANARGNVYSRKHVKWNPDIDREFWAFSWHEIGYYDVPATIDYILNTTGQEQLYHVGHSQGTTTYYVMVTTRPEYNAKIKAHFSLAPVGYASHMFSPLMHAMALLEGPLDLLSRFIGKDEFLPNSELVALAGDLLCSDGDLTQIVCVNAYFAIFGFSPKEMNASVLPVVFGHIPAGSSAKQFWHYGQLIKSGTFRQYDFRLDNWKHYGQFYPPKYDLGAASAPMYMFYSRNDWMSAAIDCERFCEDLGESCKGRFLLSDINHLDYLVGNNAPELIYNKIISLMARH